MTHHGETPHSNPCSCHKTGAWRYGLCSPRTQCWFICHWCKIICLRQYNGTCSVPPREQMYSLSVFLHDWRKKNHPFMTKQLPAGWTCLKKSYADSTECIKRELITLLLGALGFVYNEDNADLSSAHIKDIANHSPVKLVLSHQESRCMCYPYFLHAGVRTTISLWHSKDRQAELITKWSTKCRPNFTECLDNTLPDLFEGLI